MERMNCWEVMGCGREPDGAFAQTKGVCPAAQVSRLDGVHGGSNGGRSCWAVAGTLCEGEPIGSFTTKGSCFDCEFYKKVLNEEAPHIIFTPDILVLLKTSSSVS